ncbi:hypothetical protein PHYBLDRAFT_64787 [Phycomyces blakesleeanus NRRL 1555(-)]|uniref:Tc1-like transposase DDE domain-containing protein n=1 Tax=Phycomyces blakesleeanus (strain ATCC 8743b / DSM 1359 / FGSC 10004 / NBRC 33097 / NRRL 1555) TaxID=763407 RepID=A0A167MSV9_PHYB8|nr:hypothetical protein PHYBLDRAFT_64787 [Phycomyces blakesleeanus NRRL 1555(-)]OAD73834.1 hypothetical protein PHYBLDRAFT_64787 [Phycomyces blakesleeanus NRRL 1555(-)]|eukprot:XP_018291874.1 hypothetical protein PHYBLDRAFT_64787 [Phycomyces blakesleeanus NRRL 1555(-)]
MWTQTYIDYLNNHIFVDKSVFDINIRPLVARFAKGTSEIATTSQKPVSKGTIPGHYMLFLRNIRNLMDHYPEMKGFYIREYTSIYLPIYSPEINLIETFWSAMKFYVKERVGLVLMKILKTRIDEAV